MRGLFFCEGEKGRREEMKKLLSLLSFTGHVLVLTQQKKILRTIIQILDAMTTWHPEFGKPTLRFIYFNIC
jgi:hypothetical protein